MVIERLQDLSVYYKVKEIFAPYPFVNVVDEFPTGEFKKGDLPLVSVEGLSFTSRSFELGNPLLQNHRMWKINVFSDNNTQRLSVEELRSILEQISDDYSIEKTRWSMDDIPQ